MSTLSFALAPVAQVIIDPIAALSAILPIWLAAFPEEPVRARDLLNCGIEERPALLEALDAAIPGIAAHPHPPRLTQWLNDVENLPVDIAGTKYRVARTGHRWTILKLRPIQIV